VTPCVSWIQLPFAGVRLGLIRLKLECFVVAGNHHKTVGSGGVAEVVAEVAS
jgi:hypothetical protein